MQSINEARYVLAVNDLEKSRQYYTDVLGFTAVNQFPGWIFLSRDAVYLMLGECKNVPPARDIGDHSYIAYLIVSKAILLYEEFKSRGVEFIKTICDEDWGMREFGIKTIDGHRMMFAEYIATEVG